jgi:hypothetical protein
MCTSILAAISLAVVPSVISHVQTLAVPLSLDVEESATSRAIFASYMVDRDEVEASRPCTDEISRIELLTRRNPETAAIAAADPDCDKAMWAADNQYKQAMTNEHMPTGGLPDAREVTRRAHAQEQRPNWCLQQVPTARGAIAASGTHARRRTGAAVREVGGPAR